MYKKCWVTKKVVDGEDACGKNRREIIKKIWWGRGLTKKKWYDGEDAG